MLENVEEGDDDVVLMITKGNITALKQHLDENPDCIEKAVDWVGDNPLLLAVWYQQEAIVTMLLNDYDANVNVKNVNKTTPIHRACQLNDLHLVQLLLDKGADYRLTDINGKKCIELTEVNEATKQLVVAKMELDREVIENALKLSESLDKQFDEEQLELQKYQHNKKIAKRQAGAVSVVVNGAKNESVNGPYDPINKIVNDWVVYRHRANSTIYIVYVVNSWLIVECSDVEALDNIVYSTDDGNATCINYKVIVRLLCESPTHPELRIEGNNGITEYIDCSSSSAKSSDSTSSSSKKRFSFSFKRPSITLSPNSFISITTESIFLNESSHSRCSFESISGLHELTLDIV